LKVESNDEGSFIKLKDEQEATIRIWNKDKFEYYGPKSLDESATVFYNIVLIDDEGNEYDSSTAAETYPTVSETYYLIINCESGTGVYNKQLSLGLDKLSSSSSTAALANVEEKEEKNRYIIGEFFTVENGKISTKSEINSTEIVEITNDYIDVTASADLKVNEAYSSEFSAYATNKDCYFRFAIGMSDGTKSISINNVGIIETLTIGEVEVPTEDYTYGLSQGIFYVTVSGKKAAEYSGKTVSIKIRFDYNGDLALISEQFPERVKVSDDTGVYYNASMSVAYSESGLDSTHMSLGPVSDSLYYYRDSIELVSLDFNSYDNISIDGNTSQLGINEREITNAAGQTITALGSFDAMNLTSLELKDETSDLYPSKLVYKLSLEKKLDDNKSGTVYSTVNINKYLKDIYANYSGEKVNGVAEGDDSVITLYLTKDTIKNINNDNIGIDISFMVLTGSELENLNDTGSIYSNYRITLTAYLENSSGDKLTEDVSDYFVYTNAKFYLGILGVNDFDASSDAN
jgi:hypothetical protein